MKSYDEGICLSCGEPFGEDAEISRGGKRLKRRGVGEGPDQETAATNRSQRAEKRRPRRRQTGGISRPK